MTTSRARLVRDAAWLGPVGLLLLGLQQLGRRQVWQDEAYTWSTVRRPWHELVRLVTHGIETNGALYNALEWTVLRGGDGAARMRALSLVAGVGLAVVALLLLRRLLAPGAATLGSVLVGVGGVTLHYAVEARTYTLTSLAVACCALALDADRTKPRPWTLLAWAASGALAGYGHAFALPAVGACVLALLLERGRRLRAVAGGAVMALLLGPFGFWLTRKSDGEGLDTLVLDRRAMAAVLRVYGLGVTGAAGAAVALLVLAAAAAGIWKLGWRTWPARLLGLWAVAIPLSLGALSLVQPSLTARYLVPGVLPVVALAAVAACSFARAAVPLLLVVGLVGTTTQSFQQEVDWNGAAAFVSSTVAGPQPVPIAFTADDARLPFEYAARHLGRPFDLDASLDPVAPPQPWGRFRTGDQTIARLTEADIAELADAPLAIAVVAAAPGAPDPPDVAALLRAVGSADRHPFRGGITILVLRR